VYKLQTKVIVSFPYFVSVAIF